MSPRPHPDLDRWLAAEAAGDDLAAEAAFGALFQALPTVAPSPGFAERVLMELRDREREPESGRVPWLLGKAAVAIAVALAGVAAGFLPLLGRIPIDVPGPAEIVSAAARGLAWTAGWLGAGLDVWGTLARLGGAIGAAVATPEMATAMMGSALVSAAALVTLHHLLVHERSV